MRLARIELRLAMLDLCFVVLVGATVLPPPAAAAADELKDKSVSNELSEQYLLTQRSAFLDYLNNQRWKRSVTTMVNATDSVEHYVALNATNTTSASDKGAAKGPTQGNGNGAPDKSSATRANGFKYIAVGVTVIMFLSVLTFMTYYFIKIKYCTKPTLEPTSSSTAVLTIKVPTRTPTKSSLKSVPEMAPLTGFS